jgi:hypothetical protein
MTDTSMSPTSTLATAWTKAANQRSITMSAYQRLIKSLGGCLCRFSIKR